jgi:DNA-binding XRE family transcriptional regulator
MSEYSEARKINREKNRVSLRAKRVDLELTLEEAAKLIGISKYSLYNYEHFKNIPSVEVALKIAEVYDIPIENLRFAQNDEEVTSSK